MKLHMPNYPIRPRENWCNAPAYKLAKYIVWTLNHTIHLPNTFNIKNSVSLIDDLNNITIDKTVKLCSFDIENMYTSIPTQD